MSVSIYLRPTCRPFSVLRSSCPNPAKGTSFCITWRSSRSCASSRPRPSVLQWEGQFGNYIHHSKTASIARLRSASPNGSLCTCQTSGSLGSGKNGRSSIPLHNPFAEHVHCRIPDLNLASQHPKRLFIRRAVDFEIRLSYYDRVVKTLPEAYRDPDLNAIASQAPGPNFEYDEPGNSYLCPVSHR